MKKDFITHTPEQTKALAQRLALRIDQAATFLLEGELGTGKTTFTQGLALGLDITRTISSPTFTIMKNYQGRLYLNHIDAYRLENQSHELGLEDLMDEQAITVIEWPQYVKSIWPPSYFYIKMSVSDETTRLIQIEAFGEYEQKVLNQL